MLIQDDDFVWLNVLSDFIEDFVYPWKRSRLYYLLSRPLRRNEVLEGLCYNYLFDDRYLYAVPKEQQGARDIHTKLKQLGAPTHCFVFSGGAEKVEVSLEDALEKHVGFRTGAILYCPKQKVGLWEEHDGKRCLLSKSVVHFSIKKS